MHKKGNYLQLTTEILRCIVTVNLNNLTACFIEVQRIYNEVGMHSIISLISYLSIFTTDI